MNVHFQGRTTFTRLFWSGVFFSKKQRRSPIVLRFLEIFLEKTNTPHTAPEIRIKHMLIPAKRKKKTEVDGTAAFPVIIETFMKFQTI